MNEPSARLPINLRLGWLGLVLFGALGLMLEALHAFKIGFYVDVGSETRRLLFRLAHAHGVLLALLNVVYAMCARSFPALDEALSRRALLAAALLMPLGFLSGGVFLEGADPGPSVALAVAGGLVLLLALIRIALVALRA
jgi:hypothetical protein